MDRYSDIVALNDEELKTITGEGSDQCTDAQDHVEEVVPYP